MLIDDDEVFRSSLGRILRARGYQVESAGNAREARSLCAQHSGPLVALVDLQLGETDGAQLIGELRLINPLLRAILISSYNSVPAAVAAMRNGAVDCISKLAGTEAILTSVAMREPPLLQGRKLRAPTLAQVEWDYIQRVVRDCGGNLTSAARVLDIPRRSLQRKLRRFAPR